MLARLLPSLVRGFAYRRRFMENRSENLFMGSFKSFADAQAGVPALRVRHDADRPQMPYFPQVYFNDYPSVFWLGRSFSEGMRSVFGVGDHVGIKYYAFRRMLRYPSDLRWTICDKPEAIRFGQELAIQRDVAHQLDFTTDLQCASGYDVLYASGSLGYLPTRLSEIIARLQIKPKRIVLNATAVHPDHTLYTLNSTGFMVSPCRIQHHDELLGELAEAGYQRRDGWRNEGKPIVVPFVKGGRKPYYAGCCFDLF